jgi:hypothetical protein
MFWAFNTCMRNEKYETLVGHRRAEDDIILKWILEKMCEEVGLQSTDSNWGAMAGFCGNALNLWVP